MRSPKCKFVVQINFDKPIKGLGSRVTYSADDIAFLKRMASEQCAFNGFTGASIIILKNEDEYPNFKWVEIDRYRIEK